MNSLPELKVLLEATLALLIAVQVPSTPARIHDSVATLAQQVVTEVTAALHPQAEENILSSSSNEQFDPSSFAKLLAMRSPDAPSASLEDASLTSTSSNPTLRGSAKHAQQLTFRVYDKSMTHFSIGQITSIRPDGTWSVGLSYVPSGSYTVEVYSYDPAHGYDFGVNNLLAYGKLSVTAGE